MDGWSTGDRSFITSFRDLYRSCHDIRVFGRIKMNIRNETRHPSVNSGDPPIMIVISKALGNSVWAGYAWNSTLGTIQRTSIGYATVNFTNSIDVRILNRGLGAIGIGLFNSALSGLGLVIVPDTGSATLSPLSTYVCNSLGALPSGLRVIP